MNKHYTGPGSWLCKQRRFVFTSTAHVTQTHSIRSILHSVHTCDCKHTLIHVLLPHTFLTLKVRISKSAKGMKLVVVISIFLSCVSNTSPILSDQYCSHLRYRTHIIMNTILNIVVYTVYQGVLIERHHCMSTSSHTLDYGGHHTTYEITCADYVVRQW